MPDICPWWLVYAFDNPFRNLFFDHKKLFGPYVSPGMNVLDIGCGRGFNTLGMARLVGESGKVVALDIQEQMLKMVQRRVKRKGLADRVRTHLASAGNFGMSEEFDFACAFWMVHETGDVPGTMREISNALKPGGKLLVAEPKMHVGEKEVQETIGCAADAGMKLIEQPKVAGSMAFVFQKTADGAEKTT